MAHIRAEQEAIDSQMQMLAWQTALLMNSTGNFKKKIKPTDLYTPLAEIDVKQKVEYKPEDKKALQEELLSAFAGSDIVTQ
ncbi:TPA: hypothetical protein K8M77_000312 [Clostridium perfringens]|nr:hypothetical protein [Clostridium perfringens]